MWRDLLQHKREDVKQDDTRLLRKHAELEREIAALKTIAGKNSSLVEIQYKRVQAKLACLRELITDNGRKPQDVDEPEVDDVESCGGEHLRPRIAQ